MYDVREGHRIHFWHDSCSGHKSLKNLYPNLNACSWSKEAWIFYLIVFASKGGERSWNLQFRRVPHDWELAVVDSFF